MNIKIKSRWTRAYYLVYILRRFLFLAIAFFSDALPAIQVMSIMFLNLAIIIYQGLVMPLSTSLDNKIELTNEFLVSICSMHLMFFTDAISDLKLQYTYGL
jgi:hypothetical protein